MRKRPDRRHVPWHGYRLATAASGCEAVGYIRHRRERARSPARDPATPGQEPAIQASAPAPPRTTFALAWPRREREGRREEARRAQDRASRLPHGALARRRAHPPAESVWIGLVSCPLLLVSKDRTRTAVVLPAPFGPRRPNTVAGGTSKSTPLRAVTSPKHFRSPLTAIAGSGTDALSLSIAFTAPGTTTSTEHVPPRSSCLERTNWS